MINSFSQNKLSTALIEFNIKNKLNKTVQIQSSDLDQSELVVARYHSILSDDEKDRVNKYKFKLLRNRQIISKGLLRVLLANYQECNPKEIEFRYNEFGKPFILSQRDGNNLSFNLSHSNNVVVYIFTQNRCVGIDVEKVEELSNLTEVIELCFSQYEKKWFNKIPLTKRKEIFYRIWTSKEAYIKAIGKGFSFSPDKISLDLNFNNKIFFKEIIKDEDLNRWKLISFKPLPDFISTFVVESDDFTIEHFNIDPKSIIDQDF